MFQDETAAVQVSDLRKAYGDRTAVDGISLEVRPGEVFGILGPNGAGKTTTVECVAGLRTGDSGSVRVHGLDPWTQRAEVTRIVGVQLQESRLQDKITVREALELWSEFYDDPVPWQGLVERLGLTDHVDARFAKLSGGQQQRLSIALALVGRPRVAILDELTTGLDPRARHDVWQLVRDLRETGVTVLLVTHLMEEAQALCDRIAIIADGRIRALDTPDGLIRRASRATVTSFVPSDTVDLTALGGLDGVSTARADVGRVVVEGSEDAAVAVLAWLAAQDVVPHRLRVADGSLDTAYLDLTGDPADQPQEIA
ncbi:ABC transporter ATP-binding protein [Nocardioides campestrisoli]|uniref:ABC transporter ATP-binding protein n=1 Tax=Nocardioides campestrisoli TaxID=2736757 RepID=UPI00163D4803|nr:ABC transporter ATP-binding protein [Nocardioides campestrisoli]